MTTRTFAPALNVMVEQPAVLSAPDLSLAGLLTRFPALAKAEAVGLTGSIAAGFGNALSDIDLFVFTNDMPELPVDDTAETWSSGEGILRTTTWMGRYGNHRVDLKVWPTDAPRHVLGPFLEPVAPEFCEVSHATMDYIYRLSIARPLSGEPFFDEVRQLIETGHYRLALARSLKLAAEARLLDVTGQLMSGDVMSARLTAVEAASIAVDCRLTLGGDYCRSQKWLLRRLEKGAASCGISPADFRSEVLDGPRAGEADIDYVRRVAYWTRDAVSAVESELLV